MATQLNLVVVEDNNDLRTLLSSALRKDGHHVTALSCAEELEDQAGSDHADAFLIDINLPGEDGLSLAQRIRKTHPLVGIIILSARSGLTLNKLELQGKDALVKLTAQEAIILTALARAPAGRLETWQIAELLDTEVDESFKASLAVRMVRLRKKLMDAGAEGLVIESLRNIGYQLTTHIEII